MARTRRDIEALAIEKGLPIPKIRHRATASGRTADAMEAGDSVYFADRKQALALCNALKYRGHLYTMRRVSNADFGQETITETGYRVWRL